MVIDIAGNCRQVPWLPVAFLGFYHKGDYMHGFWYTFWLAARLFTSGGLVQYEPLSYTPFDNPVVLDIGAEIGYGSLHASAQVSTDCFVTGLTGMSQFMNTYTVAAGLKLGAVDIGIEHSCYHPAIPYQWLSSRSMIVPSFEGAYTALYVRVLIDSVRQ